MFFSLRPFWMFLIRNDVSTFKRVARWGFCARRRLWIWFSKLLAIRNLTMVLYDATRLCIVTFVRLGGLR